MLRSRLSFPPALAAMDGRSREARLLKHVRRTLTAHLGGAPSATEAALIERAAWLQLRVSQLDAKLAEQGDLGARDTEAYLAWSNALTRTLRAIGLAPGRTLPRRGRGRPPKAEARERDKLIGPPPNPLASYLAQRSGGGPK